MPSPLQQPPASSTTSYKSSEPQILLSHFNAIPPHISKFLVLIASAPRWSATNETPTYAFIKAPYPSPPLTVPFLKAILRVHLHYLHFRSSLATLQAIDPNNTRHTYSNADSAEWDRGACFFLYEARMMRFWWCREEGSGEVLEALGEAATEDTCFWEFIAELLEQFSRVRGDRGVERSRAVEGMFEAAWRVEEEVQEETERAEMRRRVDAWLNRPIAVA